MKALGDKQRCFKTLWDVVPRHKLKLKLETASEGTHGLQLPASDPAADHCWNLRVRLSLRGVEAETRTLKYMVGCQALCFRIQLVALIRNNGIETLLIR